MVRLSASRNAASLALLVVFLVGAAAIQGQAAPAGYIEIVVRPNRHPSAGDLDVHLRKSNIQLFQGGKRIPIRLLHDGKNAYPTHLLLVTETPLSGCDASDSKELRDIVRLGWTLRVVDTSGEEITQSAAADPARRQACSFHHAPAESVLAKLGAQPGRRIVIFDFKPNPASLSVAAKLIPEVYTVDGGLLAESFTPLYAMHQATPSIGDDLSTPDVVPCHEIGNLTNPNDPCYQATHMMYRRVGFSHGVTHEKSLRVALDKALQSAQDYYQLSFQIPPSATTAAPLDLHFCGVRNFRAAIVLYATTNGRANTPPARISIATPLVVKTR